MEIDYKTAVTIFGILFFIFFIIMVTIFIIFYIHYKEEEKYKDMFYVLKRNSYRERLKVASYGSYKKYMLNEYFKVKKQDNKTK